MTAIPFCFVRRLRNLLLTIAVSAAPLCGQLAAAPAPAATTPGAGTSGGNAASCSSPTGNPANRCLGNGNPINLSTGNKYQRDVDLPALPGVMGLEIVRHYNSLSAVPGAPNGILGRGWRLSYEVDLYAVGSTIQIIEPDGHRVIFNRDPLNPSHCSTPDPANGSITIRRTDRGDAYLWTRGDGAIWDFNEQQKLVQITALTGETVNLQYDTDGLLLQVTDPQGRRLQLTYLDRAAARSGTQFSGVQSITSPVGRFDYGYGSTLPKGATLSPVMTIANLVSVTSPSTAVRQYHYEDPLHPTLMTGISITGSSDNGGTSKSKDASNNSIPKPTTQRLSTFAYQADGRAILSTHANNVNRVTLNYPDRTTSILTNSLGQTTVYRHADIAGEYRLLEARGPGCRLCDAANVRFGYDRLGRTIDVTRLAADGTPIQTIHTTRDYAGRPLTVGTITYSNGKPNPLVMQQCYEYGPGNIGLPTLIARPSVIAGREALTRITYNAANQPLTVTDVGWAPGVTLSAGSNAAAAAPTQIERTTTYRYTQIGRRSVLAQIDGPLANGPSNSPADSDITHFDWDVQGINIVAATTPGNFKSQFSYDEAGRLVQVSSATGERTTMTYGAATQLTAVTQNGVTQRYQYDAMGHQIEVGVDTGEGYRALTRFGFDEANRPIWNASHLGILNGRRYDTESNLLGTAVESSYFKQAQTYEYDTTGRLVASIDAQGGTRTLHWNAQGLPDALTNALGRTQQFRYDAKGRLDKVIAAANDFDAASATRTTPAATRFERDAHGNTITVIAPNGAITRTVTDDFGQVIAINSADAGLVTRSYDVAGRLIASTDANGNAASYAYDAADRIVRQNVTDTHAKDPYHRKVSTVWTYAGKHLVAIDHPNQSERYGYDSLGNLASKTVVLTLASGAHATSVTRYRYDQQGQLLATTLPDGSVLNYRRNGQHQIVAIERSRIDTAWLAWLLPTQTIVKDLQRDLIGLRHIVFGNGIEAQYQRSKEGALARIVVRRVDGRSQQPMLHAVLNLLGITPAQASTKGDVAATADKTSLPSPSKTPTSTAAVLPGALSAARDLAALIDHRYLWDLQGNLLYTHSVNRTSNYAYDAQDRLIAAGTIAASAPAHGLNASVSPKAATEGAGKTATTEPASYTRYFYDNTGNRVLAQEAVGSQDDTISHTVKTSFASGSNRWQVSSASKEDLVPANIRYDASGQPQQIGQREYVWNALGKLTEVRQEQRTLATYRYNNSGQRISKTAQGNTTYYLYENRQLSAELDEQGRITRQYIYLADQPVAIIDTPQQSVIAAADNTSTLAQISSDLATVARDWFGSTAPIVYLHANYLGATELVTDAQGDAIWRAEYQPYGKAKTVTASISAVTSASVRPIKNTSDASSHPSLSKPEFQLNLRLPGQYEDVETGLHYNDYRYYDPARGQYLTPDPIGLRGGLNSYAYVQGNPLKYVDPLGLILFAFDGSNNSNPPPVNKTGAQDDFSNVYKFYLAYDADLNGPAWYMNGVGRNDPESGINATFADGANAYTARARVDYMLGKLDNYMATTSFAPGEQVNIDIVGFSRGAAMGRDFSNRVAERMKKNAFEKSGACMQIRFMGLWDTVAQFGENGIANGQWQLAIPSEAQHVFQAVALNENRYLFPGESIGRGTQRSFIGSHADIGGSYGTGDLSNVALNWIVEEAKKVGVKMKAWDTPDVNHPEWGKVGNPVLHDKSVGAEDRSFCLRKNNEFFVTNCQLQRQAAPGGMTWSETQSGGFISLYDKAVIDADGSSKIIGEVDMTKYGAWLKQNYGLVIP